MDILKSLNKQHPPNIIPLIETLDLSMGKCIVLPERISLDDELKYLAPRLWQNVNRLSHGLINGLSFLHDNLISHLDIKPSNLVHTKDFELQIIDFDVAVQLESEDEQIDEVYGTKGWMAPEIEQLKLDGYQKTYSPIKADRWSCGLVLYRFAKKCSTSIFEDFATKLLATDPNRRPQLSQWKNSGRGLKRISSSHRESKRLKTATE